MRSFLKQLKMHNLLISTVLKFQVVVEVLPLLMCLAQALPEVEVFLPPEAHTMLAPQLLYQLHPLAVISLTTGVVMQAAQTPALLL